MHNHTTWSSCIASNGGSYTKNLHCNQYIEFIGIYNTPSYIRTIKKQKVASENLNPAQKN